MTLLWSSRSIQKLKQRCYSQRLIRLTSGCVKFLIAQSQYRRVFCMENPDLATDVAGFD